MGMHNKGTYTRVYTCVYARMDIRVYAKYARIIRVCVVRIYLSCTVNNSVSLKLANDEYNCISRHNYCASHNLVNDFSHLPC